jgi:membrane protein
LGAVVAYYAVLSLPALLVIIINTVGAIWGNDIVEGKLTDEIAGAVGQETAESIRTMIANTQGGNKSVISTIIGIATLIFGATGVFYHLQISINEIWELKPDPKAGIMKIVTDRARGFAFVLILGFLLLISFIITTLISILNENINNFLPDVMAFIAYVLNFLVSVSIISLLFALIFRYLPDAKIMWKTVWIGGVVTALLFILGKFLLGLYFGKAEPASTYGAAGSIVLILLWVSYSCLILFFGAQFTVVYSKRYGKGIVPDHHAIHVKKKEVIIKKGSDIKED